MVDFRFSIGTDFSSFNKEALLAELKINAHLLPENAVVNFVRIHPTPSEPGMVYFTTWDTDNEITSILENDYFADDSIFRVYS